MFVSGLRYAPGGALAGYTSVATNFDATWNFAAETTERIYRDGSDTELFHWDVAARDENGNVLQARELAWNQRQDFIYDTRERLVSTDSAVSGDETVPLGKHVCAYAYDGAGNRSSEQCFGQTSVDYGYANGSNRLASQSWAASEAVCGPSASEVVRDSTHDARGRATLAYRDAFLGTPEAYGLRYGPFGRLSGVDLDADGSDDVGYLYDDAGLRRSKTDASGAATQRFHYSLGGALLGESGADGARDYIWVAGELIGVVDDAGAAYHLTTDHLGSPRRAFDASSGLAWGVDMEAFGRAHPRANAIEIPIRFPGQYEDAETGLHYNWNRFYNPTTGRYLTEDALVSEVPGFGESVYGYARNNPALYTDPDGRCPICIAAGIIVAEAIADLLVVGGTAAGVVAGTQVIDHYMSESQGDGGSCEQSGSKPKAGGKAKEELPALDSTGKVHGKLPKKKDLGKYQKDELRQLQNDLRKSVRERIRKTVEMGRDKPHGQRQGEEQQLIKDIGRFLGDG